MAVSQITALQLGNFLQIAFSEGIRSQISSDYRDWEMIKQVAQSGVPDGRQLNFMFQRAFGPSAVQYRGATQAAFPPSQKASTSEHTATYKEVDATVELEYNLWNRARKAPSKYAEPLAIEIQSKTVAAKRRMAADLYNDGTGVVGQLGTSAAALTSPTSDSLTFTISSADTARGHVGFFEFDDILVLKAADGTGSGIDTNLSTEPVYWKVVSKNRAAGTVTLQGLNSSFASAGAITSITTQPSSGSVFYRYGQNTGAVSALDLTAISSSDYGTLTEGWAGLETLTANDGRVVHGITMSGSTGGGRFDCGNATIDTDFIHGALDNVKINVGKNQYSWKKAVSAPEAIRKLINDRESDRRFQSIDDNKRGVKQFGYVHEDDTLMLQSSEYCPKRRMYLLPEGKSGNSKVLEFHGTDFEPVKGEDMSAFHLKPSSSGGHDRVMVSYMEALAVLICKHPAAIGVLYNFQS